MPEFFLPSANDIEAGELRIETKSQRRRRRGANRIGHDAKTFGVSFDVVEEHDLGMRRPRRYFGDRADFQITIRAVDDAQFTELVDRVKIPAQIFIS